MADDKVFLTHGKLKKAGPNEKADYTYSDPSGFFSSTTNLIPQLSGVSGGRVLLGDKAHLQAISLTNREVPLVQAVDSDNVPFIKHQADKLAAIFAKTDGKVKEVNDTKIITIDGKKTTEYQLYKNFLTGKKSFLHHEAVVKEGDTIKKGDLLAKSNFTDDKGNLAIGVNLTTAVMPYRSLNFEDAYVITRHGAEKLVGEQMIPLTVEKERGLDFNKDKFISLFANKYYNNQLANVDADGVIKKGSVVNHGDPLLLAFEPRTLKTTDAQLGNLSNVLKNAFTDRSYKWDYDSPGEVADVAKTNKVVTITIKTKRPITNGDKISLPFGAKGVISTVLNDSETPKLKDGTPVDVILNSMSIVSRIAPSLITTMMLGKVAKKTGNPIKVSAFSDKSLVEEAQRQLKEHGLTDTEDVYDPIANKHLQVLVGPLSFNRLHHISEDKISGRGQGVSYDINMQPAKVLAEEKAKRIGNLATNALLAHNAKAVLEDAGVIRSTKNDEFWRRLKTGADLPDPEVPFIFNKFVAHLEGAGIKVQKNGTRFNILPQTNKDVAEMSKGEIENPNIYKIKQNELIPEEGGLFDVNKVGIEGSSFNHINLVYPSINPVVEDYIRKLMGITQKQFDDLVGQGVLIDKLKAINTDKEITRLETEIKSTRKTDRANKIKVLAFLKNLKTNDIKLNDLVLDKIPVIPSKFRPLVVQGGKVISSGVNELYRDFMLINQKVDDLPDDIAHKIRQRQYEGIKAVYGLGDPISVKNRQKSYKGLLASALGIHGGSAKESMFQSKVVNKPLDLVGRAVLTTDANLDLNEVSLPQALVWKMYSPFVIRRLVQSGVPVTNAKEYVDNKHPIAGDALADELKERPVTVSRDPQLHKYSQLGFMVKQNADPKDSTLKLNPLLSKGFGFDMDGDQMNAYVPASEQAKAEIISKMLPSKNLISPRSFTPAFVPSNEAALGLYLASTEKNEGKTQSFDTQEDALKAYHNGTLDLGDKIKIGK